MNFFSSPAKLDVSYRPYGNEAFKRLISLAFTAASLPRRRLRFELFFVKMCRP
jgi:hypothetical protein